MKRDELVRYLNALLEIERFKDYSPNGLQVEGRSDVRRIVAGVTASQALIDAGFEQVFNVQHGFEGELDDKHHRNSVSGWRVEGLPWQQC